MASPGSVLFLVENLPLPFDRRVWLEMNALRDVGFEVAGISPAGRGYLPGRHIVDGIRLYRYVLPPTGGGFWPHVREYAVALAATLRWAWTAWHERRFQFIHACNPPDLFFLVGWLFRPFGVRFVFDQHDLVPEIFRVQYGESRRLGYRIMRALEWLTLRSATHVIATNETLRDVAIARGRLDPVTVTVVRTGPDAARLHPVDPDPALRGGHRYLVCYVGVMGIQDGVELALKAARHVLADEGEPDTLFAFVGDGDDAPRLRRLAAEYGIADRVLFTGRVPDEDLRRWLSSADVCLSPDPANGFNEMHTMNKTMEYMAMGRPVVAFDLQETRVSGGDAALYAPSNDVRAFANSIVRLLRDPDLRQRLGEAGLRRIEEELSWEHSHVPLVDAYARLVAPR